jgi:hypothetical protein
VNVSVRAGNRRPAGGTRWVLVSLKQALCLLGILTISSLFYIYTEARALDLSYQASRAASVQRELVELGRRLRVELNSLRSPERLEREGARLGLAPPPPERVRALK